VRFRDIADGAGPDDLRGHAMILMRETLIAHLGRDFVFGGGFQQEPGLPRSSGERLLDVNMFAALLTGQANLCVHQVGNGDGAGVDVLPFLIQHHSEVAIDRRLSKRFGFGEARSKSTSHSATIFSVRAASFRSTPP